MFSEMSWLLSARFNWINVFIIVLSVSSCIRAEPPITVRFKVEEEAPLHTTIGNVSQYLLDQPRITSDSPFFKVTPSGMVQMTSRVDLEALCTERSMCCDLLQPCELVCTVAIESETTRAIRLMELRIRVLDINDNPPQFPTGPDDGQMVRISELAEVGHLINLIPATDRDIAKENQIQRYLIHGAQLQRAFELDYSDLSNVRLRLQIPLDYETVTQYTGTLEACDPRSCASQNLTVLVLDENDNRPMFVKRSYEISVPENLTVGQMVLQLEAEDKDSARNARMDFRFHGQVDPGLRDTFRLERDTGRLVLQSRLAAQRRTEYRFAVTVDGATPAVVDPTQQPDSSLIRAGSTGTPDVAKVVIHVQDLNDFSPQIRMFSPAEGQTLRVAENAPPQRVCVVQVTDEDVGENARVACHIVGPKSVTETFALEGSGKYYTLSTTRTVDAELEAQFTVTIVCTDAGNPPRSASRDLLVRVDDVNEHAPQLVQSIYRVTVQENAKAGTEVVRIQAEDRDQSAQLHYDLKAEGKQYFGIDPSTGMIFTLGDTGTQVSTILDREKTEQITLNVCVTDGPPTSACGVASASADESHGGSDARVVNTASATVYVTVLDENDNRPVFTQKGPFFVTENQPRFTQVRGQLAAMDPDEGVNGEVRYSLRQAWVSADGTPAPDLFQVDAQGRIRTMEVLDREKTNAYTLELVACDSAPQTPLCTTLNATVTVDDENDNKPVWHYPHEQDKEVNITSDLPPGHLIVRIRASDRDAGDNGRVIYTLIDPHKRTVFEVDNYTGDVAIARDHSNLNNADGSIGSGITPAEDRSPLLPGIYRLRLRASDLGHPQHSTETWLQVNVFGPQIMASAGLNFMIIVVMVAVTGLISICLVIAIICVRRRSNTLRCGRQRGHPHHHHVNGVRRGRDAGDGAEVATFPLKHEYGYPIDGAGYMMGISPTPSDLDTLKLAYHPQTGNHSVLGTGNGCPDGGTLYGWTGHPAAAGLCYSAEAMSFYPESAIASPGGSDPAATATLRLPVYRLTPTSEQIRLVQNAHGLPVSTCVSFVSNPSPDQMLVGTSAYSAEAYSDRNGPTDEPLDPATQTEFQTGHFSTSRHSFTPLSSTGAPSNSGCCHAGGTSVRRYGGGGGGGSGGVGSGVGPSHYELDVESADSGRGASEDDPNHVTVGSLVHFYPTFHLPHGASLHMNTTGAPSGKTVFDVRATDSLQPVPGSGTAINGAAVGSNVDETANGWSTSERQRLKC